MQDKKVTEKTFCKVIEQLMKDKETKAIYNKVFEGKPEECQLKK